ncbi:unnamed protein product [Darwinula stevensoni]|uniref:Serrate RNA effector molecule homolog n=1 Tax=Darwinula stevensoni TaxID=69355 RepID=A0A7R9ABQ0_9CRUS|nr:unnamed protein product [Darwinula stevensoni]CAG0899642.1 unnamed protein product [Darwinula stevensoni]
MGDSDDDYDRRSRDKFRRERRDYTSERGTAARGEWEGGSWGRGGQRRDYRTIDYNKFENDRRYSPGRSHDMSPPAPKRMRSDWEGRSYGTYDSGYSSYGSHYHQDTSQSYGSSYGTTSSHSRNSGSSTRNPVPEVDYPTQPPMMSFKAFLQTQDDSISDDDAIRKYGEYKLDFKRQQLHEFFLAHKEEEWFKGKYHPEDSTKRNEEHLSAVKHRLEVFNDLMEQSTFSQLSCDADQTDLLLKLLDSVVIKLEGGTDFDLNVLDEVLLERSIEELDKENMQKDVVKKEVAEEDLQAKTKDFLNKKISGGTKKRKKKERRYESGSDDDESDSEDEEENEEESEPAPPGMESLVPPGGDTEKQAVGEGESMEEGEVKKKGIEDMKEEGEEGEDMEKDEKDHEGVVKQEVKEEGKEQEEEVKEKHVAEVEGAGQVEAEEKKPRAFHKTASIFLRNLAPNITKQEVEAMCKRFNGFLRAAIADPQPERRWYRRGWVTFDRTVNIKEICWNLNNIRLRDTELGAIVNRDLTRRIRTVNGITCLKQVMRQDIKVAAKVVQNLDAKFGLWGESHKDARDADLPISFGMVSNNPFLKNITEHLIEEASAEEEELLGEVVHDDEEAKKTNGEVDDNDPKNSACERDEGLAKVLDRLILYLRIVHSVDYYNHSEYPHEDEMPNRCGIMHVRGSPPMSRVTQKEISDYLANFENKIKPFLQMIEKLSEEEAKKLGLKDADTEVEKFIQANTQELAKDKWLCPLSGKKFKGPDFVRKHIFNKHAEKVDEVKKEVLYFNNYVRDTKRPQLPEHPSTKSGGSKTPQQAQATPEARPPAPPDPYYQSQYGGYGYGRPYGGLGTQAYSGGYGREYPPAYSRGRGGYGRRDRMHSYKDLDAPPAEEVLSVDSLMARVLPDGGG